MSATVRLRDITDADREGVLGPGSPEPFNLHRGSTKTGTVMWGEDILRLHLRSGPTREA